ncbi:FprA family A-type flavoprotein [uncultured Tyzzerella sp.]|uniref:FprA family A-type flavoprotein n=1 Tax=uncultured Tyzzerella sp. TaxID=2321398 RepID=UPI002942430F|nr:FprA family A-type flavoprotein [uncultured Tyzzerella sp.]
MKGYLKVKDDIFWVGALDFDIRTFDVVMYTEYGTTYNSYVVKGSEKTAIIEAAKGKFFDEYLERLNTITSPEKIDYLVVNHTEPDHTGAIEKLLDINPNMTIIGSAFAIKFLKEITNKDFKSQVVKEGEEISLGNKTLTFLSVPFLHWPDSMYTYIKEDKTLFTCDSFGCHYCDEKVFNDLIEGDFLDSYKYYFDCIMGPFKEYIKNALEKIKDLEIETICPGHGPVLRTDIEKYVEYYKEWCKNDKIDEVVVGYVSSYGYTKILAEEVAKGVEEAGIKAKVYDLEVANKDEVLANIGVAKGLLIGTPTIADDTLPPVWDILVSLNANVHKGLKAGVFGSYGWNGTGITNVEGRFKQLKFKMPVEPLKIPLNPSAEQKEQAYNFGKEFANNINM